MSRTFGPAVAFSFLLALSGCGAAGSVAEVAEVADDALAVVEPSLGAANAYVESVGALLKALSSPADGESRERNTLERQRAAMAQRAGPGKFRNEQLTRSRENLQMRDPTKMNRGFQDSAARFHYSRLHELKTVLNEGPERDLPAEGSLKAALGLQAAIELGLAPALDHPVLGELLPLFAELATGTTDSQ